ncbi:hypothetical protein QF035_004651 [Streptomyces umbrinus]|uniref:Uncharacterized protein n=1 Tax=Streptomyces umbrinus TaxID=67370 RepID=A0ABU0SX51_9ACTN|nr:hypothetical protein [Streptomyces umbrinus]
MMSGGKGFTMPSTVTLKIVTRKLCCGSWLLFLPITYIKPLCQFIEISAPFGNSSPRSLFGRNLKNTKQ